MNLFEDLKDLANAGAYTMVKFQTMINNYYKTLQISDEEFLSLCEIAKTLNVNSDADELNMRFATLEKDMAEIKVKIENIESYINLGIPLPEEKEPDGSKKNPITAYRGISYYYDLYYYDVETEKIYHMIYQDEEKPDAPLQANFLPHEIPTFFEVIGNE